MLGGSLAPVTATHRWSVSRTGAVRVCRNARRASRAKVPHAGEPLDPMQAADQLQGIRDAAIRVGEGHQGPSRVRPAPDFGHARHLAGEQAVEVADASACT